MRHCEEVDNGEDFDGVQFAYFQYFHYNFTVTRNALRNDERQFGVNVTDGLISSSTVVFFHCGRIVHH